jgi:hypothetical protein
LETINQPQKSPRPNDGGFCLKTSQRDLRDAFDDQ